MSLSSAELVVFSARFLAQNTTSFADDEYWKTTMKMTTEQTGK